MNSIILRPVVFKNQDKGKNILTSHVMGIYSDGLPWSGAMAKVSIKDERKKWKKGVGKITERIIQEILETGTSSFYKKVSGVC